MSPATRINGHCPYQGCGHAFIRSTPKEIGGHFGEHVPFDAPSEIAGKVAMRLMDFRRVKNV